MPSRQGISLRDGLVATAPSRADSRPQPPAASHSARQQIKVNLCPKEMYATAKKQSPVAQHSKRSGAGVHRTVKDYTVWVDDHKIELKLCPAIYY